MEKILYDSKKKAKAGKKCGRIRLIIGKCSEWRTVGGAGLLSSVSSIFGHKGRGSWWERVLVILGNGLIFLSVAGLFFTFFPVLRVEWKRARNGEVGRLEDGWMHFGDLVSLRAQGEILGVPDADFSLFVPKIGVLTRVIANINAGDETQYKKALQEGVAHAAGTGFPGEGRTIFLFAHSVGRPEDIFSYNAVFYLLKDLEIDDRVTLIFGGKKYEYEVFDKRVAEADEVGYFDLGEGEVLVMQTCWPPGTTWKRIMVLAKRV